MRRSSPTWMAVLPLLLASALAAPPAGAGSVEVLVRDQDGRPLSRRVSVEPLLLEDPSARRERRARARAIQTGDPSALRSRLNPYSTTDSGGRASFEGLPDGSYRISVKPRFHEIPPERNPFLSSPVVTVRGAEDRQRVVVELWRGTPVRVRLDVPAGDGAGFAAVFTHRETGVSETRRFREGEVTVESLLAPGIWEVSVTPRPGFLLVGVWNEGIELAGHSVTLDLALRPQAADLLWTFAAPGGTLQGTVVEVDGKAPAVTIEAVLERPGPWIEAARRRGGSIYERVTAPVDARTGRYEIALPDGDWRVQPVGSLLIESEPRFEAVTVDPGGVARADFTVRVAEPTDSRPLMVRVVDPEGRGVGKALVAAFPAGEVGAGPVATATSRRGSAILAPVPAGDYLLVAGHPGFLEGHTELRDYDPDRPQKPRIELGAGAEILFEVRDGEERAVPDVELEVERLGDPPPTRLADPELAAARQQRTVRADHSGRARMRGFYPGRYRLRAERLGTAGSGALIHLVGAGGELERELERELGAGDRAEVEGRQLPAATLQADLVCGDNWPLPEAVSVRVVKASAELPRDPSGRTGPKAGVALALDDLVLVGSRRDRLVAGPVPAGIYRLAVRPAGFDRWSWAFETHDPHRSTEISLAVAADSSESREELETMEIECGPAIDLRLETAGGDPFPDLPAIEVEARLLAPERDREIAQPPWSKARKGWIEIRGLPAGEARLDLTLEHPHFLPEPVLGWRIPVELERGGLVEPVLEIEGLGGAIELRDVPPRATTAVAVDAGGERREVAVDGGVTLLPSLVPGTYQLRLHAAGVDEPIAVRDGLEVRPGVTLRVDAGGSTSRSAARLPVPADGDRDFDWQSL